ncbi:hypothetical protein HYDPIDRAFT_105679 [Hydnomerulius pinastri MD-312]|nr:hypothetical protein HYDPIDRAFT_105679 [Hydnomerulius pinastri MD-312]
MELLAFKDGNCEHRVECNGSRPCPFSRVRFAGLPELGSSDGEISREVVSQILADSGVADSAACCHVSRAFARIPGCMLRRDTAMLYSQRSKVRPLDFAVTHCQANNETITDADILNKPSRTCLMLGMKGPAHPQWLHRSCSRSIAPTLASILRDLADHAQSHLTHLSSRITTTSEPFPEWLILFGVVYDSEYVRIIAHVPYRREEGVLGFVSYLVDELPFPPSSPGSEGSAGCQGILERLRVALALMTLRRHVAQLAKSLFGDTGLLWEEEELSEDPVQAHWDCSVCSLCPPRAEFRSSRSMNEELVSEQCSTEYSTCPSDADAEANLPLDMNVVPKEALVITDKRSPTGAESVHHRRPLDRGWDDPSSDPPSTISFCSTCSSLSDLSASESAYSERSTSSESEGGDYMEPSTTSLSQGEAGGDGSTKPYCPGGLTKHRRSEIASWARKVVPSKHPIDDTYRMTIHHSSKNRRYSRSITRKIRH